MTNYELMKNMSIEEMAVTITCPNEMGMADIECDPDDLNCCKCCLEWLQQECNTTEADTASGAKARVAGHDGTADKMARGE